MNKLIAAAALAVISFSATPADKAAAPALSAAPTTPFSVQDLVRIERIASPRLSPDGRYLAYQLRQTDMDANKGVQSIWLLDLSQKNAAPLRLTAAGANGESPRWSADGRIYFLSSRSGSSQLWRTDSKGAEEQLTKFPLDIGSFKLTRDGKRAAVSMEVFAGCADLACTSARLAATEAAKAKGIVFDKLFIRHWDTFANGTRAQLFLLDLATPGAEPALLTKGIDGDVPTKPFGDDAEYDFSADGRTLYFNARIAGKTEAWSTNTDIYSVPVDGSAAPKNLSEGMNGYDIGPAVSPDGKSLAWRSMKRAGFEADRNRIMVKDLASGAVREVAADWDRSAGSLQWTSDGRGLLATASDLGQVPLVLIDVKSGKRTRLTDKGQISAYDTGKYFAVVALDNLRSPAQLYSVPLKGGKATQLTHHNEALLAQRALGEPEQFKFAGANNETVYGHVVKPANYVPGRKYPVAFIVHGGPQGSMSNDWHYRWNPQTYAGAGFAVVFIDFHGSDGYGQAFTDSISGDWGGKPLEDLQKGWAFAQATYPFLDGSNACALGASYGGFMMFWIEGHWNDAFKCIVAHDGVFDSRSMGYSTEELWFDEWENGGLPWEKPENYERFNPVNAVDKWKTPMLVVHGSLDYRIPDTQGIAAFTALQRRGIESRLLLFPNENHWVLKPADSVQWHETVLDWLRRYTGP